jgi:hypothetical protein
MGMTLALVLHKGQQSYPVRSAHDMGGSPVPGK